MTNTFHIRNGSSSSLDQVNWEDTDSSEDEDYLPQQEYHKPIFFTTPTSTNNDNNNNDNNNNINGDIEEEELGREKFNRMNQTVWATIDNLNRINDETLYDQVRRVIDFSIDNGSNIVNLSKLDLTQVPNEIQELKYFTTIHNSVVKSNCLQLYLYSNQLQVINPALFELNNLTVLSLRDNKLKAIPPEVGLLENLVELSIGNNQLEVLPAEILKLKNLGTLALKPNPLLPVEKNDKKEVSLASLVEIAIRHMLTSAAKPPHYVPSDIMEKIKSVSITNACQHCHQRFLNPNVKVIHWREEILGNQQVPFLYRFCSTLCSNQFF